MAEKMALMDTVSQGVYIIGTKMDETYNLMTAAWITQVSFSPARIALAVDTSHYTSQLIDKQGAFSVSVLAKDQEKAAKACGFKSGREVDKTKFIAYELTEEGLPVILDAAAVMTCKVTDSFDLGDHMLYIGEIQNGLIRDKEVLIYNSSTYF